MEVRKVFNLIRAGHHEEAEKLLNDFSEGDIRKSTLHAFLYFLRGQEERAMEIINNNLHEILKENVPVEITALVLPFYSYFLSMTGKITEALEFIKYTESLIPLIEETASELDYLMIAGDIYNVEGIIYNNLGENDKAIEYYTKSIEYRERARSNFDIGIVSSNLALIYIEQGMYRKALMKLNKSIEIFHDLGYKLPFANSYSTIGYLLTLLIKFDKAKYYLQRAIEIFKEINHPLNLAEAYFRLITLYIESNQLENAKLTFAEFSQELRSHSSPLIQVYIKLALAKIYINNNRLLSKAKAMEILNSLDFAKNVETSLYSIVLIEKCNLLLFEITLTQETDIIKEINYSLKELADIAKKQKSKILTVKSMIIQSKLLILLGNFQEASVVIKAGYKIAREMEAPDLIKELTKIKDEQNLILRQWEEIGRKYKTMSIEDPEDLMTEIIINFEKLESIMRRHQKRQLEEDDVQNKERLLKIVGNANLFPFAVYKVSDYGVEPIVHDFDDSVFLGRNGVVPEIFLTQFGIVLSVLGGQGEEYATGMYDMPAGALKNYRAITYLYRLRDEEANDPRLDLGYSFYCLFIPEIVHGYLPPNSFLEKIFRKIMTNYKSLNTVDFFGIKEKVIQEIRRWIEEI